MFRESSSSLLKLVTNCNYALVILKKIVSFSGFETQFDRTELGFKRLYRSTQDLLWQLLYSCLLLLSCADNSLDLLRSMCSECSKSSYYVAVWDWADPS
jgi:hypothetical protein